MIGSRARILIPVLLVLGGCNLFNPSGKGDPDTDQDWLDQGAAQLRALEFDAARESYGHVLAHDSASTPAWIGYAKAVAGKNLDLSLLLREALASEREHRKPLWDSCFTLAQKDSAYRGIRPVRNVFETWARLDSLGRASMPAVNRTERGLLLMCDAMLSLWDSNNDGRITAEGDKMAIGLFGQVGSSDTSGLGFLPDLDPNQFVRILPDGTPDPTGEPDPAKIEEYNTLLQRSDREIRNVMSLARQDTAMSAIFSGVQDQNPEAITLFQVANIQDDDMDGCADEEIIDGLDNDGDGLIDEDARVGYVVPSARDSGDLAQISPPDHVRGDRLVNPRSGVGLVGSDSAGTLRRGDSYGHLEIFRPMWSPKSPLFSKLHWKYRCDWSAAQATAYGTTCHDGALMDPDTRIALGEVVRKAPPGRQRAVTGCALIGGCWCKLLEDVCKTTVGCDAL